MTALTDQLKKQMAKSESKLPVESITRNLKSLTVIRVNISRPNDYIIDILNISVKYQSR